MGYLANATDSHGLPAMSFPILITSFAPWQAHQLSNSSDDLLMYLHRQRGLPANVTMLRHLPVNYELAPAIVMAKLLELCPRLILCCGMAESRPCLSLEQTGRWQQTVLYTSLDLTRLVRDTRVTQISDHAGNYVCNYLYFRLLDFIQRQRWPTLALFIHVPVLTSANRAILAADFALILRRLTLWAIQAMSGEDTPYPAKSSPAVLPLATGTAPVPANVSAKSNP
ncbi:Pyrrolidone-carboxylate peptidase [Halomicronema hongdechloris C2206]|uniref:Pyrrolidone-carboxylate peptidase n=2 Tax=Halomicronema hongdechloris TaxID=1209493 RepID=A0A1Z3HPI1_9CYAN|nr:Pyrrolidone-carboxylate peptidase [Halomicronema hongdechloris C2206]